MLLKYIDRLVDTYVIGVKYICLIQIVEVICLVQSLKTGPCKPNPAPRYVSFVTFVPWGDLVINMDQGMRFHIKILDVWLSL